jgi:hypothetical protein
MQFLSDFNQMVKDNFGIQIIKDDDHCKLLAWCYEFGFYYETCTQNQKLFFRIQEAQKRLGLFGGEVPNRKLCKIFNNYRDEILEAQKTKNLPQWCIDLFDEYNLSYSQFLTSK